MPDVAASPRIRQESIQVIYDDGVFHRCPEVPDYKAQHCRVRYELAELPPYDLCRLSDSYEQYYQAVRRCWRFGQTHPVDVYIIISAKEGCVKENIERKEADAINMRQKMAALTRESVKENLSRTTRIMSVYQLMCLCVCRIGKKWRPYKMTNVLDQYVSDRVSLYHGDSVEMLHGLPDNCLHYSIFSPPFSSLYTYSNSDRDMGNSANDDQFYMHFGFLIHELARASCPGDWYQSIAWISRK